MKNLICFPHYTAGGLLCDILTDSFSPISQNGGIQSPAHSIGKIGDADSILDQFDVPEFLSKLKDANFNNKTCVGTHCWPGILDAYQLADASDQIVLITTTAHRSKLYRWLRAYYHYYEKSQPWLAVSGSARIDKERETAKNYIEPFLPVFAKNIINLEFAEIVDNSPQFKNLVKNHKSSKSIKRWQRLNNFLYNKDIWNSVPAQRFYEAELEINTKQCYVYDAI